MLVHNSTFMTKTIQTHLEGLDQDGNFVRVK